MSVRTFVFLLLFFCVSACQPPKPPMVLEKLSLAELAENERSSRRAASLRLVEQGRIDLTASRYGQAAQKCSQALEVDSGNPYAYYYLGLVRFRVERFNESAELFLRASKLFGDSKAWKSEALAFRGESLERVGRLDDARSAYEEARELDFSNERAHRGWYRLCDQM